MTESYTTSEQNEITCISRFYNTFHFEKFQIAYFQFNSLIRNRYVWTGILWLRLPTSMKNILQYIASTATKATDFNTNNIWVISLSLIPYLPKCKLILI